MQVHEIPRDYSGEGRILYIFTTKSIIYSAIGATIGWLIYFLLSSLFNISKLAIIIIAIFAVIGYAVATFKIPDNSSVPFLKKVGGEKIDAVILRYIKFKQKKRKIYVYTKEEQK